MRKFALFAVAFLVPIAARADMNTIRNSDSAIWGSVGADFYNYKEPASAPDLPDSERGWIPSVGAGVSWLGDQDIYLSLESSLAYGDAKYRGAYLFFPTVAVDGTTRETISDTDGKIGYAFPLGADLLAIPYAEVGYRYWRRRLSGDQTEDYDHFDAMGGLMLQYAPFARTVFSAYGSGGSTMNAEAKTPYDNYDLYSRFIYKVGGKIGYNVTDRVELFTAANFEHFSYGASGVRNDFTYEPDSHTNQTTLQTGLSYHFK